MVDKIMQVRKSQNRNLAIATQINNETLKFDLAGAEVQISQLAGKEIRI